MKSAYLALACVFFAAQSSLGASVTFLQTERPTTAAEIIHDPLTANRRVYDFFLTSSGDILSINNVTITINGTTDGSLLYQNDLGSSVEPPNAALAAIFISLNVDSWISTPGGTSTAGGGFSTPNSTWFDSDSTGPATNFQFARLTIPTSAGWIFTGVVSIPDDGGQSVLSFPFEFTNLGPEPASGVLAGMGLFALASARRRR